MASMMELRRNVLFNRGTLQYWLSGEDPPIDGKWIERKKGLEFELIRQAVYDNENKLYDFGNDGAAVNRDWNNGKMYLGHHWRVEFDVLYNAYLSKNGTFFDIGSVTEANGAFGTGLNFRNTNRIAFNWKMLGNNSNPFTATQESRSHPALDSNAPDEYLPFQGFIELCDGGDGYDRVAAMINGIYKKYETQIPQVSYGPSGWKSMKSYWTIGECAFTGVSSENDGSYSSFVKIKEIKVFIID